MCARLSTVSLSLHRFSSISRRMDKRKRVKLHQPGSHRFAAVALGKHQKRARVIKRQHPQTKPSMAFVTVYTFLKRADKIYKTAAQVKSLSLLRKILCLLPHKTNADVGAAQYFEKAIRLDPEKKFHKLNVVYLFSLSLLYVLPKVYNHSISRRYINYNSSQLGRRARQRAPSRKGNKKKGLSLDIDSFGKRRRDCVCLR